MKQTFLALVFCGATFGAVQSQAAITVGPFGSHGEGGAKNGQQFLIGTGGSVYELDAFLFVGGQDLNGADPGTSAALSRNSLPPGVDFAFSSALSADNSDLVLSYTFSNTTSAAFSDVRFFVLFDAEIDQTLNTFFNEYGTVKGTVGHGAADGSPDQWQIDEPGFLTGTLFRNLYLGTLSNSNSVPQGTPDDVAMALGFSLGDLNAGGVTSVRVMISEDGSSLGSLALVQRDLDPASKTFLTLSGGLTPALEGAVFVDANTNGAFDAGEGLTNVTLRLLTNGVTVLQTVTDADGRYSFSSAPPGTYSVQVEPATLPPGLALAPVQNGATANPWPQTLVGGVSKTLNWGYHSQAALTGWVFVDANTNGLPDTGEGLPGVTVLLLTTGGAAFETTTTDAAGRYSFGNPSITDPPPGPYSVRVDEATLPPTFANAPLVPVSSGAVTNPSPLTLVAGGTNTLNWGYRSAAQFGDVTALVQLGIEWRLSLARGSLIGVWVGITNPPSSGATLGPPFHLGLRASPTDFFYPYPVGVLTNGVKYVDLTSGVTNLVPGGLLPPGGWVVITNTVVTNGVLEVYSRTLKPPTNSLFELWATRQ